MLKAVRAIFGATLVMAAVSACGDDPLSEGREDAAYFQLNPTVATVDAGGTITVNAVVVNRYGGAIDAPVTATTCDAKITAVVDTTRNTQFEPPERFRVTGQTLGESCLIVSGGGVTDTITLRVVPAGMRVIVPDEVGSGEESAVTVQFLNTSGQPVTGFDNSNVTFSVSPAASGTIAADGTFSGRTPGATTIRATLKSGLGASRVDSAMFVVVPGEFMGGAPATAAAGTAVTFTADEVSFDADTRVTFEGVCRAGGPCPVQVPTFVVSRTEAQITVIVPWGTPAEAEYIISNMGPNQIASAGTMTVTGRDTDPFEPNYSFGTAAMLPATDATYYFGIEDGDDLYFGFELAAPQAVTFNFDWNETTTLVVMYGMNSAGSYVYAQCFAAARPLGCTINLPAGKTVLNVWEYGAAGTFTGDRTYEVITTRMTLDF